MNQRQYLLVKYFKNSYQPPLYDVNIFQERFIDVHQNKTGFERIQLLQRFFPRTYYKQTARLRNRLSLLRFPQAYMYDAAAFSGLKLKTNFSTFSYLLSKMLLISCL